jgi:putative tryptophan/tyrosine transport system substrate-binding protein
MQRRPFIVGLGSTAVWPGIAAAQRRSRLPLIGVLWFGNTPFPIANFRQGLADEGLIIGENVAIDFEFAVQRSKLPTHAADLVNRRVDVIFVSPSLDPVRAVQSATTTIPIVFFYGGDPVEDGFVASLGRPGGNITGVTGQQTELTSKRMSLLHDLIPSAKTIAFLTVPKSQSRELAGVAANNLGLDILFFDAVDFRELERAFTDIVEHRADALMVDNTTVASNFGRIIITLAERHKIPAMYPFVFQVRNGGLISYGPNVEIIYRRMVTRYVASILRGAKPSELPVQQPTNFGLVINMRTASALGLKVPEPLLSITDEVVD